MVSEETINKYLPQLTVEDTLFIAELQRRRCETLSKCYEETKRLFERYKYEHLSNNYLKMHGKPMRRRR